MKQILSNFSLQQDKSRTYISALFYFIDYLLQTPEELNSELKRDLTQFIGKEGGQQMQAEKEELSPTLAGIFELLEKKGIEKGKREGFEEANLNVAKKLIKEKFTDKKIAEFTGLGEEDIAELRKSLQE